jgi:hypothetical protein
MSMRISAAATAVPLAAQLSRTPSVSRVESDGQEQPRQISTSPMVKKPTEIDQVFRLANSLREALRGTDESSLGERVKGNGGTLEVGISEALSEERLNNGKSSFKSPAAKEAMAELEEVIAASMGGDGGAPSSMAAMVESLEARMIEKHGSTGHLLDMVI